MKQILKSSHDITRFVRFLRVRLWRRNRTARISAYLAANAVRKLQVGSGTNLLEGWLNTDYFPGRETVHLDACERYPFPDESIDYVFSEHCIEHVHYADARAMLRQCHRVLRPGGRIRIATPDLQVYAAFLKPRLSEIDQECVEHFFNEWIKVGFYEARHYIPSNDRPSPIFVLNDLFRNYDHRFIYDFETLAELMTEAGFAEIERAAAGRSSHPAFDGLETHADRVNAHITLVVEGRRPMNRAAHPRLANGG